MKITSCLLGTTAALLLGQTIVAQPQQLTPAAVVVQNQGQREKVSAYRVDGHWYVNAEQLARIAGGFVAENENEVIVSLDPDNLSASKQEAMSPAFMKEALQTLSSIDEWQKTLGYAVQKGVPGDGSRLRLLRDRAAQGISLTTVAASNDQDREALQLLITHFNNADKWYTDLVEARKAMSTGQYSVTPDALERDAQYQALVRCSSFLRSTFAVGVLQDDGSCR